MKKVFALLFRVAGLGARAPYHDDRLRANQFDEPSPRFSFWRALVS